MASTASSRLLASGGAAVPGTPTSFSASASTTAPKAINLSWAAPSTSPPIPLTGYYLYRGATLIATQSGTTFTDTGLAYNTSYTYTVYAYNANGQSATPASTSATTAVACSNAESYTIGGSGVAVTVPTGCFKVRIRALSGGAGGLYYSTDVHLGGCNQCWSGGGGGAYISGYVTVTPGTTFYVDGGNAGSPGYSGASAGYDPYCSVYGGQNINAHTSNPGGYVKYNTVGASVTDGGYGGTTGGGSNVSYGGAAALSGTNPTGISGLTHGGGTTQGCGCCSGCTGNNGQSRGGGGAGGTDSSALYGETAYQGGSGASGYCVWTFSES